MDDCKTNCICQNIPSFNSYVKCICNLGKYPVNTNRGGDKKSLPEEFVRIPLFKNKSEYFKPYEVIKQI